MQAQGRSDHVGAGVPNRDDPKSCFGEMTQGNSEIRTGAILSYVAIIARLVVALAFTPVMLRALGQTEYGVYSLVASVVGYLSILSFGLGGAYMRFYARFRAAQDAEGIVRLNGMFLIVFTVLGALTLLSGGLFAANVGVLLGRNFAAAELNVAKPLFIILAMNLAFTLSMTVFNSYVMAHERFAFQKLLQIIQILVDPLITLPILLLGYGSIGMAIANTVVSFSVSIWTVGFCLKRLKMRFTFRRFDFALLREVAVFSSYLFINMVVDQINWNVDKFLIGRFHGAIPVAVYGVAALINMQYLAFSTAVSNVFIPRVNRMVASEASGRDVSILFTRVGRMQFLVLGLIISGFAVFGQDFIELWAGESYGEAYYIALVLLVPVTFPLIQNLGIEVQKAKNLHRFRSLVYLGVAVGNILLSIPLTQRFGAIGAASATGAALVVGNILIMNWHYHQRVGLDIRAFWFQILKLSRGMLPAAAVGAMLIIMIDLGDIWALVGWATLYVGVYCAGMWCLGMNEYERSMIVSLIRRLLRVR